MRRKIFSDAVENAQKRAAGLRSINAELDLGNGLTLKAYETEIEALGKQVNEYNEILAGLDAKILMIRDAEKMVRDLTECMLEGVSARFTKNSDEYSRAGGVRKVDRKRPLRRQAAVSIP